MLALLGPSGSGKTTLLRIIAGLDYPDAGRVLFGGDDATVIPVQKRAVGFVFQHYALFRHLTVAGNVAYGLNARPRQDRVSRPQIRRRVGDLLDLVKLTDFADRYPSQLSGGQRQRVALARALAVEPRVMLLDEPFGALDAQVRKDLRRWLREIHKTSGQTTIFVTHDQDEALELADRVAILERGRLEQIGTPDEVQDAPASAAVMRFLGDVTELSAIVRDNRMFVGARPVETVHGALHAGATTIFVRPWHFAIAASAELAHVHGAVADVVRTAGRRRLRIVTDEGTTLVADVSDDAAVTPGASIGLVIRRAFRLD